jgi:hypothetical protein
MNTFIIWIVGSLIIALVSGVLIAYKEEWIIKNDAWGVVCATSFLLVSCWPVFGPILIMLFGVFLMIRGAYNLTKLLKQKIK